MIKFAVIPVNPSYSILLISYRVIPVRLVKQFYHNMPFYTRQRKRGLECIQKSSLNTHGRIFEEDSGLSFLLCLKDLHKLNVALEIVA